MIKLNRTGMAGVAVLVVLVVAARPATLTAGDDDPEIQKLMEQIHTSNRAIGKVVRKPTALEAASRTALAADAARLARLGKDARGLTQPAQERKKPHREWTRSADDFLSAVDTLAKLVADSGSTRTQVTESYQKLQKTCLACHSAFREEAN